MTMVLDTLNPVQVFKQKFSKNRCFYHSVRVYFLMGPKEQEIASSFNEENRTNDRSLSKKTLDSIKNNDHVDYITP